MVVVLADDETLPVEEEEELCPQMVVLADDETLPEEEEESLVAVLMVVTLPQEDEEPLVVVTRPEEDEEPLEEIVASSVVPVCGDRGETARGGLLVEEEVALHQDLLVVPLVEEELAASLQLQLPLASKVLPNLLATLYLDE
ncbi:uncharacterized protein LOC9662263 isoform X1 [Selaginella moellendorffii]|uniref:uncharacterized protein LOC9662263 isoform X1 n=1 Tax=Selaginella moellendorffii TaxID=88036 RepID=UPI000D1CC5E4|nr:uncharacterized protein LOC9662263 isoform X1 [Selaginella moellendorffii]|eukprot:XP_024518528.1 uncharacterized protein LOC9662263 isoform X1 [Selaginella moellendorffii]